MASSAPLMSLDAVTSGTGDVVDFDLARRSIAMFVIANGTVTGGTVAMELSQDGTNFYVAATSAAVSTGVNQSFQSDGGAYRYARARVVSGVTGGGTVTATFMEAN